MKHILIITLFAIQLFATDTMARQQGNRRGSNRVESLKIAHLSGRLNLPPETAERFWPVYHQYEQEMQEVVAESRRMNRDDARTADEILEQEQKALDVRKKYTAQFGRIIGDNQVNELFVAERDFRQMLIRRSQRIDNHSNDNPSYQNVPPPRRLNDRPGRLQVPGMQHSSPTQESSMPRRNVPQDRQAPPPPASAPARGLKQQMNPPAQSMPTERKSIGR